MKVLQNNKTKRTVIDVKNCSFHSNNDSVSNKKFKKKKNHENFFIKIKEKVFLVIISGNNFDFFKFIIPCDELN